MCALFDCVFNFSLTNAIIYIKIKTSLVLRMKRAQRGA